MRTSRCSAALDTVPNTYAVTHAKAKVTRWQENVAVVQDCAQKKVDGHAVEPDLRSKKYSCKPGSTSDESRHTMPPHASIVSQPACSRSDASDKMSVTPHIPTFHFSQLTMSDPPVPFLAPSDLGSSPTPFDLSGPLPPPLLPQPAPSTLTRPDRPLFLGIDSGVDRIKACVLDEELRVVWTAKVDIDQELREYGCVPFLSSVFGPQTEHPDRLDP